MLRPSLWLVLILPGIVVSSVSNFFGKFKEAGNCFGKHKKEKATVEAPLGDAIGAPLTAETCDAIYNLFMAADLRLCWDEFVEDAKISLFEKRDSKCKVVFQPDEKLIEKLSKKKIPLKTLSRYAVHELVGFKMVTFFNEKVSAKFYCSKERLSECEQLMPMTLGTAGSLLSCFSNWQGLEIARIDPMIMLIDSKWLRSVLMDPEFTLQGMPHMVRSKPWVPAAIEYENGQFKIETDAGDQFFMEPVSGIYIPHSYLDAVARIYRTMEMYGDFYYVPRTAPRHLHIKSCFPLSRLFLEADITPHEKSEKPFEELTYLFVPSNSFYLNYWRHSLKITAITDIEKSSKDGFRVLKLTCDEFLWKLPATLTFYCAEAKQECGELFTKIVEIKDLEGGLQRCEEEWNGLTLERTGGKIEFKGIGMKPFVGLPLPQTTLLFDATWLNSKLASRRKDRKPSAAIPEAFVKAVDLAYKTYSWMNGDGWPRNGV